MVNFPTTRMFAPKLVTLTGSSQEIFGPSERRYAVIVGAPQMGDVWLGADSPAVQFAGYHLRGGNKPLYLGRDQVGDLIKRPWNALGDFLQYGPAREGVVADVFATNTGVAGAAVTATLAGAAGYNFWLTNLAAGYSGAGFGLAQLTFAAANQEQYPVFNAWSIDFSHPIPAGVGNLISLTLSLVAAVTATASIRALKTASPQIAIVEIFDSCACEEAFNYANTVAPTNR